MTEFKSTNQQVLDLIEKGNVKAIFDNIYSMNEVSEIIFELVVKNSNDFTKDIAEKAIAMIERNNSNRSQDSGLSQKQAWCIAYQIKNNIETYKLEIEEIMTETTQEIEFEVNINTPNGESENINSFDNITEAIELFEKSEIKDFHHMDCNWQDTEIELVKKVNGEIEPLSKSDLPEKHYQYINQWMIK